MMAASHLGGLRSACLPKTIELHPIVGRSVQDAGLLSTIGDAGL